MELNGKWVFPPEIWGYSGFQEARKNCTFLTKTKPTLGEWEIVEHSKMFVLESDRSLRLVSQNFWAQGFMYVGQIPASPCVSWQAYFDNGCRDGWLVYTVSLEQPEAG